MTRCRNRGIRNTVLAPTVPPDVLPADLRPQKPEALLFINQEHFHTGRSPRRKQPLSGQHGPEYFASWYARMHLDARYDNEVTELLCDRMWISRDIARCCNTIHKRTCVVTKRDKERCRPQLTCSKRREVFKRTLPNTSRLPNTRLRGSTPTTDLSGKVPSEILPILFL